MSLNACSGSLIPWVSATYSTTIQQSTPGGNTADLSGQREIMVGEVVRYGSFGCSLECRLFVAVKQFGSLFFFFFKLNIKHIKQVTEVNEFISQTIRMTLTEFTRLCCSLTGDNPVFTLCSAIQN